MKLFDVGRAPMMLIAFPTPCRNVPCSPAVSTAPAPRKSSDRKFRPLSGRSVICFSVMTWPTVAVSESRATASAFTSITSVSAPVCSVQVDTRNLIDEQADTRLLGRAEALQRRRHRIGADRQERDRVGCRPCP